MINYPMWMLNIIFWGLRVYFVLYGGLIGLIALLADPALGLGILTVVFLTALTL
jgi:hypothetical protein